MAQVTASAKQMTGMEQPASASGGQRWLTLARGVWTVVVVIDLLMFVASIGPSFALFQQPCVGPGSPDCSTVQLAYADWRAMQARGITPVAYASFTLAVIVAASLIFFAVGFLIAWRKWGELLGLFVSATLITFGSTGVSDSLAGAGSTGSGFDALVGVAQFVVVVLSYPALAIFMLTFPTGKFAPRWTALDGADRAAVGRPGWPVHAGRFRPRAGALNHGYLG